MDVHLNKWVQSFTKERVPKTFMGYPKGNANTIDKANIPKIFSPRDTWLWSELRYLYGSVGWNWDQYCMHIHVLCMESSITTSLGIHG